IKLPNSYRFRASISRPLDVPIKIVLQNLAVAYPRKIFRYDPKEAGAFEGDIILPPSTRGVGEAAQEARWTNGIVPYVIKSGDFNAEQEAVILKSMRRLEQIVAINNKLCIQFRPKISTDQHFTTIKTGIGCTSTVGQNWYSTKELTLGNGCIHEGTIMHELLHTLGFWHEQSRPDRDNYVTIEYANVEPGLEHAFNKYTTSVDTLGTPYDYESLMHYGSHDFSSNGKPTIVPKNSTAKIGQGHSLSRIDILEVQLYYQCIGPVSGRLIPLYRYTRGYYDHLYTTNGQEIGTTTQGAIGRYGYKYQGVVGQIYDSAGPQPSFTLPFYRYLNILNGQHLYTSNWREIGTNRTGVVIKNWMYEENVGYLYPMSQPNTYPLYHYYHVNQSAHFYTTSIQEIGTTTPGAIGKVGYQYEGIAGYIL
ncbi:unnamed protein product, partial [Adineta steineri]